MVQTSQMLHLHPSCGLGKGGHAAPDYAVYVELVSTARPCMRHVTAMKWTHLQHYRSQVREDRLSLAAHHGQKSGIRCRRHSLPLAHVDAY